MSFPPSTNATHRSQIHRLAELYGMSSVSAGSGAARYTTVTRLPSSHAVGPSELSSLISSCFKQLTVVSSSCPVHHLQAVAPRPSASSPPLPQSSAKREKKREREQRLQAKAAKREENTRRLLLKRMEKMKARLQLKSKGKAKGGKAKNAWNNGAATEGQARAAKAVGTAVRDVSGRTGRALMASSLASSAPIPTSNTGHRMLLALGWKGGGLGVNGEGIAVPVAATIKLNSRGLGAG